MGPGPLGVRVVSWSVLGRTRATEAEAPFERVTAPTASPRFVVVAARLRIGVTVAPRCALEPTVSIGVERLVVARGTRGTVASALRRPDGFRVERRAGVTVRPAAPRRAVGESGTRAEEPDHGIGVVDRRGERREGVLERIALHGREDVGGSRASRLRDPCEVFERLAAGVGERELAALRCDEAALHECGDDTAVSQVPMAVPRRDPRSSSALNRK